FPPHSRGFLYYYSDPKLSLQAGSVRLRTTTDDAVSSFHRGRDLRLPSGMPWQIIVPQIATRTIYVRLCQQLLHEGMVTEELLSRSCTVFAGRSLIYPETTVFGLQHPFLVNFQQSSSLSIVGPTRVHDAELKPFSEMAPRKLPPRPFTGSGVACFERSTLPKHARKRVILLRILKILEPVTCTVPGYTGRVGWPKEGELHTVSFRDGPQRPWSYDVDNNGGVTAALRNLFDAWQVYRRFPRASAHRITDLLHVRRGKYPGSA
ncbi:hypothetical protein C8J57DRAFT_1059905, partial [Mycena rebaudengoi]